MPFVVDTSVSASWLMPDEDFPVAEAAYARLAVDHALAPGLRWFEMRNLFIVNERRGRIDSDRTRRAPALLDELPIRIDSEPVEASLLHLARRHRLTVYDAAYLELAQRARAPLATLDAALASAARSEHMALIGG
jgi:predicted nucleic acid-binding protein